MIRLTVQEAIYDMLSQGVWRAPHEVKAKLDVMGVHCAHEATTARIRDLRKPRYGAHHVPKRRRQGTDYYEYKVELQKSLFEQAEQRAA